MHFSPIEGALGGIGLFLLGMRLMSEGIRTVADSRIRLFFASLTANRFYSIIFGAFMASIVNSGSAALIFTLGLVNGGVLNVFQALNVLAGVLLGVCFTLHFQIIPYSLVSTPLIFTGVLFKYFARRRRVANVGDLLLGVGTLFLALSLLENSFLAIDRHPLYAIFNESFFHNNIPASLFGAMASFLLQSSRSSAAVVASLCRTYQIDINIAYSMILGGFLGVAVIGRLAALGGNAVTRRVSKMYFLATLAVAGMFVPLSQFFHINDFMPGLTIYKELAWMHTIAALLIATLITLLSGIMSRLSPAADISEWKTSIHHQPSAGYLDVRILNTPPLAVEQARKEIGRMISVVSFMYADVREILFDFDARRAETIRQHEQVIDSLNHEITAFLATLSRTAGTGEINYEISIQLQTVADLEHIGDRSEKILECIVAKKEGGILFSDAAMDDLKRLSGAVSTLVAEMEDTVKSSSQMEPGKFREAKSEVRSLFDALKVAHFERLSSGICQPQAAMLYNDITYSFTGIAELCWNIMASQGRVRR